MTLEPQGPSLLLDELRRLVRLRWLAVAAVVLATIGNALGEQWSDLHARVLWIAAAVLAYNVVFHVVLRRTRAVAETRVPLLVWGQLVPDLLGLTVLTVWTGGLDSPLLLVFVLLMVVASLLLSPVTAYAVATLAALMIFCGLWMTGQWPADREAAVMALAWLLTLLLTVYLGNHVTLGLRARDAEVRRQSRRTQAILDAAADAIITIDESGVMRSVNPAGERLFGYQASELIGRNVRVLMPEPYRGEHDGYLQRYLRTGEARIIGIGREAAACRKDGTVFPIELAVSEVAVGGGRLFTGIIHDISERKNAEATLKRLNEDLLRHQEAMIQQEKMAAMGQMAAGVAHEIANPLASMDSLLQLVARHPERMNADTIGTLRKQIARIDQLVRQMKDFAHPVETGWETVPVNDLVKGALEMIRFDRRIRRARVDLDLSPDAGRVHVMPDTIEQVVVNLVLNALDALVGVDDPRITVATRREAGGVVIDVTDNGKGIRPEHADRIFEPFFTTKPVGQGTGLGLSISLSLVSRNRGRIVMERQAGPGTTFRVHLPTADGASRERERGNAGIPRSGSG